MKLFFGLVCGTILLLTACATIPQRQVPDPVLVALNIRSIAVDRVAYATFPPTEQCTLYFDDDFRSALVRGLRGKGYETTVVGRSVPRSFSSELSLPSPGEMLQKSLASTAGADVVLTVWVNEYWENCPCGCDKAGSYLTVGAVAVLYKGSPPIEVWRNEARDAEQGSYSANDLIWLVTSRLTDRLLGPFPPGPKGKE